MGRELRAFAGRSCGPLRLHEAANSSFKITDRAAACGGRTRLQGAAGRSRPPGCGPLGLCKADFYPRQPSSRADGRATQRSSPPPGGGCGLPVAKRPILTQDTPQTNSGCGLPVLTDPICSKTRPNRIVPQYKIVQIIRSPSDRRTAVWGSGNPPFASARAVPPQAAARSVILNDEFAPARAQRAAASARRRPAVRHRICVRSAGCSPGIILNLHLNGRRRLRPDFQFKYP